MASEKKEENKDAKCELSSETQLAATVIKIQFEQCKKKIKELDLQEKDQDEVLRICNGYERTSACLLSIIENKHRAEKGLAHALARRTLGIIILSACLLASIGFNLGWAL